MNVYSAADRGGARRADPSRRAPARNRLCRAAAAGSGAATTGARRSGQPARARSRRRLIGPSARAVGERRFRATSALTAGSTGAASLGLRGRMTDLAQERCVDKLASARTRLSRPGRCCREHRLGSDGTVKWLFDVGAGNAVEQPVYIPEVGPRHACACQLAGRLRRAGCPLLLRRPGHQGFSRNLRRRATSATQLRHAEHQPPARTAAASARRPASRIHNVRDDGAWASPCRTTAPRCPRLQRDARRPRLRPVAPPRHGVSTSGRGADDRPPARRAARWPWPCPCTHRTTRCATNLGAPQPQVPAEPSCWPPVPALPRGRAARLHHVRIPHARRRRRAPAGMPAQLVDAGPVAAPEAAGGPSVRCRASSTSSRSIPFPASGLRRSSRASGCWHVRRT
jgi:hypothetical protein